MLMVIFGNVTAIEVSRMFWFRFMSALIDIPMLENFVDQATDEVRCDCVIAWGLYIELRLLRSYVEVAKFTLAVNVL